MAHHRRYRHRRTLTFAETAAVHYRQSLYIASQLPPEPRILRVNGTYYANEPAMERLKKEFPVPPGCEVGIGSRFGGFPVEPMPKWMEGAQFNP